MINEQTFVKKLKERFGNQHSSIIKGIGDDAAVVRNGNNSCLIYTCDSQVEDIHFLKDKINSTQVGKRAISVAVSDIAAMGAVPKYCLVSLIFPKKTAMKYIDGINKGIAEQTRTYGISVIGGNISNGDKLIIDVFVVGQSKPNEIMLRSGAKIEDCVLITGTLGDAKGGLEILLNKKIAIEKLHKNYLIKKLFNPQALVKEGRIIGESRLATSMIDISDGISTDLSHILDASSVGVKLYEEKLPISSAVKRLCELLNKDCLDFVLNGGEEYGLCFTASKKNAVILKEIIEKETKTKVTIIGEIIKKEKGRSIVLKSGKEMNFEPKGWDHLKSE